MAIEFVPFKFAQRWFGIDYLEMMVQLLPDGFAWIFDRYLLGEIVQDVIGSEDTSWQDDSDSFEIVQDTIEGAGASGNVLRRFLSCFASEFERIESHAWEIINQTDPGVAIEALTDWELDLGLPEDCFADLTLTTEERQRLAHAKEFVTNQTATAQFYIDYADAIGFEITVSEIPASTSSRRMGVARMGFERMGGSSGESLLEITVISGTSDTSILICAIEKMKPAHVVISWVLP